MSVLTGRVAVVTGAARGVGEGIARALAAEGAAVAVVDLRQRQAGEVVASIEAAGGRAAAFVCDLRDTGQVEACVTAVVERLGAIDVLVNNAISATVDVAFEDITDAQVDEAFSSGPRATIAFMRAAFPHLRDSAFGGRVINLRSGSEVQGLAGFGSYIAAKAAVSGLTRVAAKEWGRHGITVNALCPFVVSPPTRTYLDAHPEAEQEFLDRLAVPRYGDAEADVGRAAVYLAGPDAAYVTGCTINVNGGLNFVS